MATKKSIEQVEEAIKNLESINLERLFRSNLGDESLQPEVQPKLEKILAKARFALDYAPEVADQPVVGVAQQLSAVYQELKVQAERDSPEYIQNKEAVLNSLDNRLEAILPFWPSFVTAAVEARGFLEDEGIREESRKAIENHWCPN